MLQRRTLRERRERGVVSFALIATHLLSAGIINRCDKTPINNSQQTHSHTHTDELAVMTKLQAAGNDTKHPSLSFGGGAAI